MDDRPSAAYLRRRRSSYSLKLNSPREYFSTSLKRFFETNVFFSVIIGVITANIAIRLGAICLNTLNLSNHNSFIANAFIGSLVGALSAFITTLVITKGDVRHARRNSVHGLVTGALTYNQFFQSSSSKFVFQKVIDGIVNVFNKRKFYDGFEISVLSFTAGRYYATIVGYDVTVESGGDAVIKDLHQPPVKYANNIGTQGHGAAIIDPNELFIEGGVISRLANMIGGVNAAAGLHDMIQINLPGISRNIFNVPGMPVAAVFTYLALYNEIKCPLCY